MKTEEQGVGEEGEGLRSGRLPEVLKAAFGEYDRRFCFSITIKSKMSDINLAPDESGRNIP